MSKFAFLTTYVSEEMIWQATMFLVFLILHFLCKFIIPRQGYQNYKKEGKNEISFPFESRTLSSKTHHKPFFVTPGDICNSVFQVIYKGKSTFTDQSNQPTN